jgi:hypothetical protein
MFQSLHLDGRFEHKILINKVLIDERQQNRPLKRLSCTWGDNINIHLRQMDCVLPCTSGSVLWLVQWRVFSKHIDKL